MKVFASIDPAGRHRRAGDGLIVIFAVFGLIVLGALASPSSGFESSIARFATSLPSSMDGLWRALSDLLAITALLLVLTVVIRGRGTVVIDLVVAVALAVTLTSLIGRIVLGAWPTAVDYLRLVGRIAEFPAARLSLTATAALTVAPALIRPLGRLVHWIVGLATFSVVALGAATPTGAAAALLIAIVSAAGAHVILGSTRPRPSIEDVADDLASLGVTVHDLSAAPIQRPGRFLLNAVGDEDTPLLVKVYGRDAVDAQFLQTAWQAIWNRGLPRSGSSGRIQQVQHEASLTFLAAGADVRTHRVVTAGVSESGDALLVLTSPGAPIAADPTAWSDDLAADLWGAVTRLHRAGVTHGSLDDHHLVAKGGLAVTDFHGGALVSAQSDQAHTDLAQTMVTTALGLGMDRAVEIADEQLGHERLAHLLPFVQGPALTKRQRSELDAAGVDLDDLRQRVAVVTGEDAPPLRKLRRVTGRTILTLVVMFVAFTALSAVLGAVDFGLLAAAVRDGIWWLIAAGFLVAQLARVGFAVSTVGASHRPIPLGPVYVLQLALGYIALAIPGSAARFAINVRFMQKQGLPPGSALAVSGLDSFGWFVVQVSLVSGILLATPLSLDLDLGDSTSSGLGRLVAIVVGVAVLSVVVLFIVPQWRRPAIAWVRQTLADARQASEGLASPRRLGMLLGGNLGAEIVLALALGAFARSLGYSVGLAELLLINVGVCLFAGLLPIPGGIGIIESGLTFGLVRTGMPEEAALATALLYRSATFYLPPIWGFFAARWLERRQML